MADSIQHRKQEAAARAALVKLGRFRRFFAAMLGGVSIPLAWLGSFLDSQRWKESRTQIRKILVVEYWQLGDIVLLLPLLRNLRLAFPAAKIFLLAHPKVLPLLQGEDVVDQVIPVHIPWAEHHSRWRKYNPLSRRWLDLGRAIRTLRQERFDLALSGRIDIRDNFLLWFSGARERIGYEVEGGNRLLTRVAQPDFTRPHRSRLWLRLLDCMNKPVVETHPRLTLTKEENQFAERFLAENGVQPGEAVIGVHAGARIPSRSWGPENFGAVVARLAADHPIKVFWFADPNQETCIADTPAWMIRVALPLRRFMAMLARCQLFICNDSGPMHIATALGVPVVSVFGPQMPEWFGPLGTGNRVVIRREFWCRPCFDYCLFDQPYCLRAVSVEEVFRTAEERVESLYRKRGQFAEERSQAERKLIVLSGKPATV